MLRNAQAHGRRIYHRAGPAPDLDASFDEAETIIDGACRKNQRYWLIVQKNGFGLYRMTLVDRNQMIGVKPGFRGIAVRELYTFRLRRMENETHAIVTHIDPPAYCTSLITVWNCDKSYGPISLDSTPTTRIALVPNQPPLRRAAIEAGAVSCAAHHSLDRAPCLHPKGKVPYAASLYAETMAIAALGMVPFHEMKRYDPVPRFRLFDLLAKEGRARLEERAAA